MHKEEFSFYTLSMFWENLEKEKLSGSFFRSFFVPETNVRYIVAVSGGPDSIFASFVYYRLYREGLVSLPVLFHFNHRLRKEAEEEEEFVWHMSRKWDLPLYVDSKDVSEIAEKLKGNLEHIARLLRYRSLVRLTKKFPEPCIIVTGHTADDYFETLLLRILRGSSPENIYFHARRKLPVKMGKNTYFLSLLSPLLLFEKSEILDFLKTQGIPFRIDSSNFDLKFRRNYLRHRILKPLKHLGLKTGILWQKAHLEPADKFFSPQKEEQRVRDFLFLDTDILYRADMRKLKLFCDQVSLALGVSPFSHRIISELIYQSRKKRIHIKTKEYLIQNGKGKLWFFSLRSPVLSEPVIKKEENRWVVVWNGKTRIYDDIQENILYIQYLKKEKDSRTGRKIKEYLRESGMPRVLREYIPYIKYRTGNPGFRILFSFLEGFWDRELK